MLAYDADLLLWTILIVLVVLISMSLCGKNRKTVHETEEDEEDVKTAVSKKVSSEWIGF
ncbi:unnamed protein product [Haemonchus placei]|uniref:FSAP_sig_propep domain-containing protein n=1 Tax=Haemonchus placei TaxID=6290 RepID=A0A0N4WBY1_HAEPC|nr:unnamed protein product [Haemonchus placei]